MKILRLISRESYEWLPQISPGFPVDLAELNDFIFCGIGMNPRADFMNFVDVIQFLRFKLLFTH